MADRFFLNVGTNFNNTAHWSTTSGGAGGASVPTSSDRIILDINSGNLTLELSINVQGIYFDPGYAGVFTQGAFTIDFGSTHFIVEGGTFAGGSANITGTSTNLFRLTGGTFTSTSGLFRVGTLGSGTYAWDVTGGVFNHNNGAILVSGGNHFLMRNLITYPLNNVTTQTGSTGSSGGTIYVAGNFTNVLCGSALGLFVYLKGNFETQGQGGIRPIFEGTGAQTFLSTAPTERVGSVEINKPSGTLTFLSDMSWNGHWNHVQGAIAWGGFSATCGITQNGYTITNGTFYHLIRQTTSGVSVGTAGTPIQCDTDFTLNCITSSGNFPSVEIKGDLHILTANGTSNGVTLSGTGTQNINTLVASYAIPIIINKVSGTVELNGNLLLSGSTTDFTLNQGVFNSNTFSLGVGDVYTQNGGTFNGGTGKLTIGSLFLVAGLFNEGSQGILCTKSDFSISIGAVFNRHATGGLDCTTGSTPDLDLDVNGNALTKLIFNRGSFNLDVLSDVLVIGDYEFNGSGGQQRGTGYIYWRGTNYKVNGQRGGNQTTRVVAVGLGDQTINWLVASDTRGVSSMSFEKPSGNLIFLSSNKICTFDDNFLVNMDPARILIPSDYQIRFINESLVGDMDIKTNGLKLPSVDFNKGVWDIYLLDDLEILGEYKNRGSSTLGQVIGAGRVVKIHGNYNRIGSHSGLSLSSAPFWIFAGSVNQTVRSDDGFLDAGLYSVEKPSGVVSQLTDITIDNGVSGDNGNNNLTVVKGIWCTNAQDLTVDGAIIIGALGVVQKTTGSVITYASLVGAITDVNSCLEKKTNFLALLMP